MGFWLKKTLRLLANLRPPKRDGPPSHEGCEGLLVASGGPGTLTFQSCTLLGIAHGKIHIRSDQWIEPASRVSATFVHLAFVGEVLYCTWKDTWYRTCIDLFSGDDQRRREPRLAVHQRGTVIALSESRNSTPVSGILLDLAVSGMRLEIPNHVEPGTMIYVETESTLVAGEVRHCHKGRNGGFEAGIEITEVALQNRSRRQRLSVIVSSARPTNADMDS